MSEEFLTLIGEELKRVSVPKRVFSGGMRGEEAADSLVISPHRLRRPKIKYATEGTRG